MRFQADLLAQAAENERVREEIRQKEQDEVRRRKVGTEDNVCQPRLIAI